MSRLRLVVTISAVAVAALPGAAHAALLPFPDDRYTVAADTPTSSAPSSASPA